MLAREQPRFIGGRSPTGVEVIPPRHGAGAGDGSDKLRQLGRRKVQLTANVPVNVDVGDIGEIAMETVDQSAWIGMVLIRMIHTPKTMRSASYPAHEPCHWQRYSRHTGRSCSELGWHSPG